MALVDTTLITKLIKEFTTQSDIAEKVKSIAPENKQEYTVELSKVYGLLFSIKMETEMLMGDYIKLLKMSTAQVPQPGDTNEFLDSLFTNLKMPKN